MSGLPEGGGGGGPGGGGGGGLAAGELGWNLETTEFSDATFDVMDSHYDIGSFVSGWWPNTGGFIGDQSTDFGSLEASYYDPLCGKSSGMTSRVGFRGVTRDVYGTALGGCAVYVFRTADSVLQDSTVSDPVGNFFLTTPFYPDTHFLVQYKAGSPDVFGTTQNTLVGS